MASIRDLRGRIRSVASIRQITRAMEMVATTKLRRFQEKAIASRPYAQEIAGLVSRLAEMLGEGVDSQPLFRRGEGEGIAVLLVTSDRGLCGAYNSNLAKKLEPWIAERKGTPITWYVYGRKGYQYLLRRGREVEHFVVEPPLEKVDYRAAAWTAKMLTEAFLSGLDRLDDDPFKQRLARQVANVLQDLRQRLEAMADLGDRLVEALDHR